jgi:hypothetical protein
MILCGLSAAPLDTPTATIRERLADLPQFTQYTKQLDSALEILDKCRRWLTDDTAPTLCCAATGQNDSIYQVVAFASPTMLAEEVRQAAGLDSATDIQAIVSFAWSCSVLAIQALYDSTAVVEIAALELYRTHLEAIAECVTGAGVWLSPDECEACNELGDLAAEAAKQADFKADGIWSGIVRHGQDGTAARDRAIRLKALGLLASGAQIHNLNSKLRAWQERETGETLTKKAMGDALQRLLPTWLTAFRVNSKKK